MQREKQACFLFFFVLFCFFFAGQEASEPMPHKYYVVKSGLNTVSKKMRTSAMSL